MANEHVLLIEDDEKNRKLARDILLFRGYRVSEAESAEAGLAIAAADPPALVIMDIELPGIDGIEALARLRAGEATRGIPVIAFTASVMPGERSTIMDAGFDAFLPKPIAIREFTDTVARQIARPTGRAP
ncbi:MAG TPA: response regulator [Usitatibacteraceae bacterium]|nr:response regulator [Usitatibacteraceae bacterium]